MAGKKKTCFIVMPITTPEWLLDSYGGDENHFKHALNHLFIPAVTDAGFEPITPIASGSDVIHADIIKNLSDSDLVLCDMSILNPNVFFELGIRTALDKPAALVSDELTEPNIPFDTKIIHFDTYGSGLKAWELNKDKEALSKHLQTTHRKNPNRNALWKYFGVSQTGVFRPEDSTIDEKLDLVIKLLKSTREEPRKLTLAEANALSRRTDTYRALEDIRKSTGEPDASSHVSRLHEVLDKLAAKQNRDRERMERLSKMAESLRLKKQKRRTTVKDDVIESKAEKAKKPQKARPQKPNQP